MTTGIISLDQALSFLAAAMAITLAPGPDNLMVLSIGLSKGKKAGILFGIGCGLGCLSHTLLAVLGISALIRSSASAFNALTLCGGLYLIWLGVQSLRSQSTATTSDSAAATVAGHRSLQMIFIKGLIANAVNPKVILFFLAFLPGFFDRAKSHFSLQALQLGVLFTAQAMFLFAWLGFFSGSIGQWFSRNPRAGVWLDRVAGVILILLGLHLQISLYRALS